jgi:hypothetical protein
MPEQQRWLKLLIRIYLPFGVLAGLGSITSLVLHDLPSNNVSQQTDAPGNTYRAYVMQTDGSQNCSNSSSSLVIVERRFGYFKTGEYVPYCFDGTPDHIHLEWKSSQTLTIHCNECDPSKITTFGRWGKLNFTYIYE